MNTLMEPTPAELEFLRLRREEQAIEDQKKALEEQLKKDKEMREEQEALQQALQKNQAECDRIKNYYDELCENGCKDIIELIEEPWEIKSSLWRDNYLTGEGKRLKIQLKGKTYPNISGVTHDNKAECSGITGSYREYLAKGMAKKILEYIETEKRKQQSINNWESAKQSLIEYFTNTSPEGTSIITDNKWIYGYSKRDKGYEEYRLKITYPNTSWIKIKYYSNGSWDIIEKYDSKAPKFETKEEWIEYLKN